MAAFTLNVIAGDFVIDKRHSFEGSRFCMRRPDAWWFSKRDRYDARTDVQALQKVDEDYQPGNLFTGLIVGRIFGGTVGALGGMLATLPGKTTIVIYVQFNDGKELMATVNTWEYKHIARKIYGRKEARKLHKNLYRRIDHSAQPEPVREAPEQGLHF